MKDHLPWEPKRLLWVCPECGGINAWNWMDADRAARLLKKEVACCCGSCYDNICGHCKVDIVEPNSPLTAEVFTHMEAI